MRIVIEDGDALTIEGHGARAAAAAPDAADGGGAPSALIRRFAEGAELAELAPAELEPSEQTEAPLGEPPLNPLRAGAEVARGETREGGSAPGREGLGEA
jgi:hypothetical protein